MRGRCRLAVGEDAFGEQATDETRRGGWPIPKERRGGPNPSFCKKIPGQYIRDENAQAKADGQLAGNHSFGFERQPVTCLGLSVDGGGEALS